MFNNWKSVCILLVVSLFLFASCGEYSKIVKSTDYEYKFKKGIEYFEDGEFARSGTLFQELINVFRGTSRADQVYFYYAKSMMGQKDYLMASQYFRTLIKEYPTSKFVEESQYLVGYCSYLMSPKVRLDQETTLTAIDALQLYINLYPFSQKVTEAQKLIDELQDKLVEKSFINARLYFDFENYKAAVIALENAIKDHPDSKYREDLLYMLLKSKFLLGLNSIQEKKEQRLSDALDEYFSFTDEFPESKYRKEVDRYYETTAKFLNYKPGNTKSN
jgi:outer membrane protein assembly factor BamD